MTGDASSPSGRLAIVSDSPLGGMGAAALWQANYFAAQGWDVLVLCREDDGRPDALDTSVTWIQWDAPLAASHVPDMVRSSLQLRRHLRRFGPTTVHVHGLRSFATARSVRRHVFLTNHTFDTLDEPRSLRAVAYRMLPLLAEQAFAVAPGLGERWTVLPHASPRLDELSPSPVAQSDHLRVLWLGRLTPQKRPQDFIRAVAVASRTRDVRGVMIGDGPLEQECRVLARQLGSPVHFEAERADVRTLFAQADCFCLLSNFEGVPFAVQEAMWCGLPVVLTPLPALQWFAGAAALYARDVDEAAAALVRLTDGAERLRYSALARARATAVISPQMPGPAYVAAYTGVATR